MPVAPPRTKVTSAGVGVRLRVAAGGHRASRVHQRHRNEILSRARTKASSRHWPAVSAGVSRPARWPRRHRREHRGHPGPEPHEPARPHRHDDLGGAPHGGDAPGEVGLGRRFLHEVEGAAALQARERELELSYTPPPEHLVVSVDPQLLGSAVFNLLQNAFSTPSRTGAWSCGRRARTAGSASRSRTRSWNGSGQNFRNPQRHEHHESG
jgi:hypothetical protein